MTFTIEFGTWLIPTAITFISYGMAFWFTPNSGPGSNPYTMGLAPLMDGLAALLYFGVATIVSLIAWLVYALAT